MHSGKLSSPAQAAAAEHPALSLLHEMRGFGGGTVKTVGLSDVELLRFMEKDSALPDAIERAHVRWQGLRREQPVLLTADEADQISTLQAGFLNFYSPEAVNPYVALAAKGPWIVTSKGAVVHDSGGYGMMGFGHSPSEVLDALSRPLVMANIMTASPSQLRFMTAIRRHIGQTRSGCPYDRFVCLNSGSESVSMGLRIADIHAKSMTQPGARHAGRTIRGLSLKGGFHGRTHRPAHFSDSTLAVYRRYLASFEGDQSLLTAAPDDLEALARAFEQAEADGVFIQCLLMEPVMGEGNPGRAIGRAFYDVARQLTRRHGALLLVDSIQAGLRAHGVLSIVDYPGFEDCDPPDMETYSKAINAGQYPLSILALRAEAAGIYRRGLYGNTMTANPRGLEVATEVLRQMTPEVQQNIRDRGAELRQRLQALADELGPECIRRVQGCGLLVSCELAPSYKAYGAGSVEEQLRIGGIGAVHGGRNALRFTPHFRVTSEEISLIVEHLRKALSRR